MKFEEIWLTFMMVVAMLLYVMGAWYGLVEEEFAKGTWMLVLGFINSYLVDRRTDALEKKNGGEGRWT